MNPKIPPHDDEAEKAILGSIMIDPRAITKVADVIVSADFYAAAHHKIFSTMVELFARNEPIDIVSVTNTLTAKKELDAVGGASYLTDLVNVVPSSAHIAHYAKIVKEKRVMRDLISVSADINESVFESGESATTLLNQIEQRIFALATQSQQKKFVHLKDELASAYERIEKLHQGGKALRGVTTGFEAMDNILSGLQPSDLIILGARPSLGKTTLALNIALAAAEKEGVPVGIFSLEMSKEQIIDRLIAAEAQVPLWRLRTGKLDMSTDFELIQGALDRLSRVPVYIDDTPSPNVIQIRSIARRLQAEHGLGLVVIDYVQLIQPLSNSENVVQQFTEISHGLKALGRELNVPVLAVSQLNRSVDAREIKMPRLSDLRETGSWEQDADVVMFIYRSDRDRPEPSLEEENVATISIAKHRNGPIGAIKLKFDPEKVVFREISKITEGSIGATEEY